MALNEEEIARQLSLIDYGLYASIELSELLNQSWNKVHGRVRITFTL
jgi:aryl carrier-like protein